MNDPDHWHTAPPPPNTWIWGDFCPDDPDDELLLLKTNSAGEPVDPDFGVMTTPERSRYASPGEIR